MNTYPHELIELARDISARHGYVQGAGGNISFKTDERMWVKASGTRLSEAEQRNIFVELDLHEARLLASSSEDFSSAIHVEDPPSGLRPSIETSLHSLMPHRWVAHVHSVGLLGSLICDGDIPNVKTVVPTETRVVDVPYVKPGLKLAQAVFERLGDDFDRARPTVVLLRNHGFVVASDDLDELKSMLEQGERSVRPARLPSESNPATSDALIDWINILSDGAVTQPEAAILCAGPYTPDETVFLGGRPFARFASADDLAGIDESTLFAISPNGSVWARPGTPQDAIEIAVSAVDFVSAMQAGAHAQPLTHSEIDELINWDAEKWRKAQQR